MARYFFRLDDIAPNMNWDNFNRLVYIFKKYNIKPLLAVIPDNQDSELLKYSLGREFSIIVDNLKRNGWIIAQHGYRHVYVNQNGGILNINKRSEFAGLDFETQKKMIENGKNILEQEFGYINIFVAPAHSFDKNTVLALEEIDFNYISDGIALYPFRKWGIVWLPQVMWRSRKIWFGLATIVLHPNTITREELNNLEKFVKENRMLIGDFRELMVWYDKQSFVVKISTFVINRIFKLFWFLAFKLKYGLSK